MPTDVASQRPRRVTSQVSCGGGTVSDHLDHALQRAHAELSVRDVFVDALGDGFSWLFCSLKAGTVTIIGLVRLFRV